MFMFVHPVFLILSVSPPTFRLPTIFSLPLISLSPMSEPRSLKVSSIQLASVILCTGWIYQLWSYIPCSQTTLMPCSENTPVSQSHLGCYCTITMVLQLPGGGDTGQRSSRTIPIFLIYLGPYQLQGHCQGLYMTGLLS